MIGRRRLGRPQGGAWFVLLLGAAALLSASTGSAAARASGATGLTGATGAGETTRSTGSGRTADSTGESGSTPAKGPCPGPRHLDDGTSAKALPSAVELTAAPGSAQRNVNFDTDRKIKPVKGVTLIANKKLPDSVTAEELSFDALLSRAGDTLESTDFPDPTFTQPRINPDRKSVKFTICLDPGSIPPGKYVGSVTLSGPPGLSAAAVSLTINAKGEFWFYFGSAVALIAAFALLVLKDAAAYVRAHADRGWWCWDPWLHVVTDPLWWATTVFALGAAFGTLFAAYVSNPSWGSAGFQDATALIGTTFAAIGGHAIISTLTPASP